MQRGDRAIKVLGAVIVALAAMALLGYGIAGGVAEEEEKEDNLGRFQVAAPDLVLDTATGRLVTSKGQVLEQPVNPAGEEIGRYSVDGYVTAVTRRVGLDVMNQPVIWPELVKGYVLLDTETGRIIRQKVYYRQPLQQSDL